MVSSKYVEKKTRRKKICSLIFRKLLSFSTKKILGDKNHLIFTNMFFNKLKCHLNVAMIIVVPIRAKKKPVIKETILIEKSMTLGKSKSLHFQPGRQGSRQLLLSSARSNGISFLDEIFDECCWLMAYT